MNKNHQAGSATSFVIIGIILVAITIGGVAFVVQRGNQARKDADLAKIASQEASQKAQDAKKNSDKTTNKPTATNNAETKTANTDGQKAADLPTTGIETDFLQIIAIALLSYVAVSFVLSRQVLRRSL